MDPNEPVAEKCWTAHMFRPDAQALLGDSNMPLNPSLRPSGTNDWPPDIIFDTVYGGAVLSYFGTELLKEAANTTWKNTFYPGGVVSASQADYPNLGEGCSKRAQRQAREHNVRH